MNKSKEILKKYWRFTDFRPLQEEIIDSAIYGHNTLAILPTSGGKSICFQIPGIALSGITIVISPLIALMEDQVKNLNSKGINASLLASSMSYREIDITLDNARFGNTKFLYTSPERLKSELFIERFKQMNIGLIVIDEAHCISEWGHEFRPTYREIAKLKTHHPNTPIIAVTASATQRVKDDIIKQLELKKVNCFEGSLERNNISYKVIATQNKLNRITELIKLNKQHCIIIYCQTRKSVKQVVTHLRALKINAGFYHGGLSHEDRKYMFDYWMKDDIKVMVATNAFGMGIDKPNVRFVLHYEVPNNIEAYYQEAGRAGRDGKESQAIAYWEQKDLDLMQKQLLKKYPDLNRVKHIYNAVCNFLNIATGSGNQESYGFDIKKFYQSFEIPVAETYYSLKILQLNGTINFTENGSHPTRLKIAIGNIALYNFQIGHDKIANLVTLLTRSYPGVFDRFTSINEFELSKQLKISEPELTKKLEFLEQYGVIDINYQSFLPKITLLIERLPEGNLIIKSDVYVNRKKIEEDKLVSVVNYIKANKCRSQQISNYFDSKTELCGKCDVCKSNDDSNHSYDELLEIIPTILPLTLSEISNKLTINQDLAQRVLRELILDQKVFLSEQKFKLND